MDNSRNFIEEIIDSELESGKVSKIITRFPPEPNGYLHIGHAKALCINFGMKEKYQGECNLRFDDTNPAKEDVEYMESIKQDIKWLGFDWDRVLNASDYFDQMYDCAVKLIKDGKAYVCDLSAEEIRATRGSLFEEGKESPYRNRPVEENLDLFERMRAGEFADGERVLRAKIDMASPNINMRDPVIYRICHAEHPHTGDKWVIYPMYDFAHPLEDAIEGITHSLCSLEFENHRPLYDWVTENCGFPAPRPRQIEFARLNLTHTVMSKRFIKRLVDEGVEALDLVVIVIVFCAGLLAVTVLYNLTNININERIREIATIKVLGFRSSETGAYVFKENLTLTVVGAIFGLGLGKLLLWFVMTQIKIDMVWFKAMIMPISYVWAVLLTIVAAIVVDFIFYFKLQTINMAEALKSVE